MFPERGSYKLSPAVSIQLHRIMQALPIQSGDAERRITMTLASLRTNVVKHLVDSTGYAKSGKEQEIAQTLTIFDTDRLSRFREVSKHSNLMNTLGDISNEQQGSRLLEAARRELELERKGQIKNRSGGNNENEEGPVVLD